MMKNNLVGVGTDLIEIERISNSLSRFGESWMKKLFTQKEIEYCQSFSDQAPHFAGRFAAKEAIAKATGLGFGKNLAWTEIEILPSESGKPIATLSGYEIELSIAHCKSHATAVALCFQLND